MRPRARGTLSTRMPATTSTCSATVSSSSHRRLRPHRECGRQPVVRGCTSRADGVVTAFTGKVEVGQGTRRALRLIVAEELAIALGDVRLVMGDTDLCPFDVGTFGSLSMPTAAVDLRRAAAAAREVLGRVGTVAPVPATRRIEIVEHDPPITPASERPGRRAYDRAVAIRPP